MATYVHDGEAIDYTPTVDVAAGAVVVQGELVGVTKSPIAANKLGALAVTGVFDFPKATGSGITAGALCYWDTTNQRATTTATGNSFLGKCVRAAADVDTTVRVRMSQ